MSDNLPDPVTNPDLFDGVLTRRAIAFVIDVVLVGVVVGVATVVGGILGFLTLGIGWLVTIAALPIIVIGYYAVTLGSPARATIGMQMMDIVLTPTRGQPLDGPMAFIHTLLFWVINWIAWPISLLFALFTPRRQMLHDYLAGTLMLRRSPMVEHWAQVLHSQVRHYGQPQV